MRWNRRVTGSANSDPLFFSCKSHKDAKIDLGTIHQMKEIRVNSRCQVCNQSVIYLVVSVYLPRRQSNQPLVAAPFRSWPLSQAHPLLRKHSHPVVRTHPQSDQLDFKPDQFSL